MDHTVQLAQQNSEVHAEFMKGNFVVQKSRRQFSLMAKDQSHEQSNKILQTNGGAAGLYDVHEALMLFLLAGPEECEAIHDPSPYSTCHHDAQLASDVLKGYIICHESSRTAW